MPELFLLLISASLLGLFGSGHCLGMCGGLMSALSLTLSTEPPRRRLSLLLAYNMGRIVSYGLAGLLAGSLGWILANSPFTMGLRWIAALLLISLGVYLAGWNAFLINRLEGMGQKLWRLIQPVATRFLPINTLPRALLVGALWGWLPCGLVYSTLLWAASQGNALYSLLLMLAFGVGTCPALLVTGWAAERLNFWLKQRHIRQTMGILIILFGLWTLLSPHPHGLMGHM